MIKRFVCVLVLLFALSLPAFGGHIRIGGAYCEGSCAGGRCSECGAECSDWQLMSTSAKGGGQTLPDSADVEPGFLLFAFAFFIVFRLRS